MKWLLALPMILASMPANAETVYLLIKSTTSSMRGGVALHSIPMETLEQCEEVGAMVISSNRLKTSDAKFDAFECIRGK